MEGVRLSLAQEQSRHKQCLPLYPSTTSGTSWRSAQTEGSVVKEGFSSDEIKGAYQAWISIDRALQSEVDGSIVKRYESPRAAFNHVEKCTTQRMRWRLKSYMTNFLTLSFPPTATPLRHCMY